MKILTLILLLLAPAAHADRVRMRPFEKGNRSIGLKLGPASPSEPRFRGTVRTGVIANVQGLYYMADWIALGGELTSSRFFKKSFMSPAGLSTLPASTDYNSEASATSLAAVIRVNFFESSSWTPYVLGGAGFHRFEQTVNAVVVGANPGETETLSVVGNHTGIVVTAGGGFEFFWVRDSSFSLEARYHEYKLNEDFLYNAQSLSFMFGFHYWWGRNW